jgi:hypothetical protein
MREREREKEKKPTLIEDLGLKEKEGKNGRMEIMQMFRRNAKRYSTS